MKNPHRMRSRLQFFHDAHLVSAQYSLAYVARSMDSLVVAFSIHNTLY
ncbi:MAG: hypothetical protein COB94_008235 [Gammaproteobacteria bacterium]|nr:hypothetical protein [Gammaproteobacteria bacterium]